MGNQLHIKSSFEQHNWRQLQNKNNRSILYNDITMKSIERHEAVIDSDQGQAIQICKWRENLPPQSCIIDLYEYGIKRSGICSTSPDLYVITERIHLLEQIGTISKPQAFLILRDVSCGLKILFKKFGFFNPRPNIIGINVEGRAKVWTNQNFSKFILEKDTIPIQTSQLRIVNNLIRILQAKAYSDDYFPIDYPRNLDLISVTNYINQVFANLKGFQVDRVYIDRTEFSKNYKQIKQRNKQQQLSKTKAMEAERRLKQIQNLHQKLRLQQLQLQRKQQLLILQAQQQLQLKRQQQLELQRQRQLQNNIYIQQPSIIQNSQGKALKGTTSTVQTQNYYPNQLIYYNNLQGNIAYSQNYPQQNLSQIQLQFNQNNFRQSFANNLQPQVKRQQNLTHQANHRPLKPPSHTQNYPHKNINICNQQQNPVKNSLQQVKSNHNFQKQIQMVDSMILMQEDQEDNKNKRYIQSRIITYQA